jgi:hypothetical protein
MAGASSKKAAAGKHHRISHKLCVGSPLHMKNRLTSFFSFFPFLFILHPSPTARSAATGFYRPFLIVTNVVYLVLRWALMGFQVSWRESVLLVCLGGLELYAYMGIMDSAANHSSTDKSLAGGASLDLLGFAMVVQFGSILLSSKFYLLMAGLPFWAAWSLYTMFGGGGSLSSLMVSLKSLIGGGKTAPPDESSGTDGKEKDDRRQKRADRRRQKWS